MTFHHIDHHARMSASQRGGKVKIGENMSDKPACTKKTYEIERSELPLSCPMADMEVWNAHPRVYLPIEKHGHVICPYCEA